MSRGRPGPAGGPQRPRPSAQAPIHLPYPTRCADLYRNLTARGLAHPVYPLARMVAWHRDGEGWQVKGPKGQERAPEVKAHAFRQACEMLSRQEIKDLAEAATARRRAWLAPLEEKRLSQRLLLTARTDAVIWLASPGPLELGLAVHHVYGFPVLPGSSLKGLARRVARDRGGKTAADSRYGSPDAAGPVAILDGLPCRGWRLQRDTMTPHFGKWYSEGRLPDDTEDPVPIPFLSIAVGSVFEVALLARDGAPPAVLDAVTEDLRRGLDELGLGAKTAAGYGVFAVELAPPTAEAQPRRPAEPPRVPEAGQPAAAPRESAAAESLRRRIKALRDREVRPQLQGLAQEIGRCALDEQPALVQALRERLHELGFRPRDINEMLAKYPEFRSTGAG